MARIKHAYIQISLQILDIICITVKKFYFKVSIAADFLYKLYKWSMLKYFLIEWFSL